MNQINVNVQVPFFHLFLYLFQLFFSNPQFILISAIFYLKNSLFQFFFIESKNYPTISLYLLKSNFLQLPQFLPYHQFVVHQTICKYTGYKSSLILFTKQILLKRAFSIHQIVFFANNLFMLHQLYLLILLFFLVQLINQI